MIIYRALVLFGLAAMVATAQPQPEQTFNHYVLSLSWSPEYCRTRNDPVQCAGPRRFAFVLHGLWPNAKRPPHPADCAPAPGLRDPKKLLDIMPSISLIQHEWRKHGTCSGLAADAYFAKARQAFDSIRPPANFKAPVAWQTLSPAEIVRQFRAANSSLVPDSVTISCTANFLTEVRVCMDQSLKPIPCPDTRQCRAPQVRIPPVR